MRIIIASPYLNAMRGNTLTAKRLINTLQEYGTLVKGIDYNSSLNDAINQEDILNSDFLHILNPIRYIESKIYKKKLHGGKKYGITFTGTDLNVYLSNHSEEIIELLEGAFFIAVFHEQAYTAFANKFPRLVTRVHIISQGYYEITDTLSIEENDIGNTQLHHTQRIMDFITESQQVGKKVIILPAGIRKIKRIPWAIKAISEYQRLYNDQIVLCIIGPVIEEEEMNRINQLLKGTSQIKYFNDVPHSSLLKITNQADILLNCSESEGQSLAIIEAFYQKTPVIASKCPGNDQMIEHGRNGYLFTDEQGFFQTLNELINNPEQTNSLVQTAYQVALETYSVKQEIEQYVALYKQAIQSDYRNDELVNTYT